MPQQDRERSGMCVLGMSRLRSSEIDIKKRCSTSFKFQLCGRSIFLIFFGKKKSKYICVMFLEEKKDFFGGSF